MAGAEWLGGGRGDTAHWHGRLAYQAFHSLAASPRSNPWLQSNPWYDLFLIVPLSVRQLQDLRVLDAEFHEAAKRVLGFKVALAGIYRVHGGSST